MLNPYPSEVIKPVEENQEPPEGWPRNPVFNAPGDVPGPPVQFGPTVEPTTVMPGEGFTGIGLPENDIFYFHPDHLGSTSYITTKNGSISQHVEYIAFGEILFEEHSSSFSSPYLFNGKELDRETNLSYYGARYLEMKTSLWLNVDPLAEKHPNIGGYVYCINNPILLKDPDGRDPITAILEGLTAFGIEAGLDFMTNLIVKGQKTDKAFENINWKGATFEGVKATTISAFLPTGTQTVSRIARISRSKIGKLALSFVENLTTEALKNYVSGKYNDSDGDFSMDMMMEDFGNLSATAAISTLLDAGMGGKAEEMYKKFSKSNEKLAKQFKKLARNLNSSGSTQRTINNRIKKIKGAATELTKDAVKATGLKAGEETVKKVGDETQKKLRGVKD